MEAEIFQENHVSLNGTITCSFDQRKLSSSAPNNISSIRPPLRVIVLQLRHAQSVRYPVILIMDALSLHFFSKERQFK